MRGLRSDAQSVGLDRSCRARFSFRALGIHQDNRAASSRSGQRVAHAWRFNRDSFRKWALTVQEGTQYADELYGRV